MEVSVAMCLDDNFVKPRVPTDQYKHGVLLKMHILIENTLLIKLTRLIKFKIAITMQ